MKTIILCSVMSWLFLSACNKTIDHLIEKQFSSSAKQGEFILYKIKQGEHFSTNNSYKPVALRELKFVVKFDSSAIYKTEAGINQYDINKLYGFSDNDQDHHQYSARFGWAWNENALRLYAYVYNAGQVTRKEIGKVNPGDEIQCSILVADSSYQFTMNKTSLFVPRMSFTPLVKGYLLYPYFGGDETAPHDVRIWIKNL